MLSFAFEPVIVLVPLVPFTVTPEPKALALTTTLSVPAANEDAKLKFDKFIVA